jgi:hypothetical protein
MSIVVVVGGINPQIKKIIAPIALWMKNIFTRVMH